MSPIVLCLLLTEQQEGRIYLQQTLEMVKAYGRGALVLLLQCTPVTAF